MKKSFRAVIVIGLTFLFPASIKTQWHTNLFLDFPGAVVLSTATHTESAQALTETLTTRAYVALPLAALHTVPTQSFTLEARVFLNDAEASANLLTLANTAAAQIHLQIRKEHGQLLTAEFWHTNGAHTKLVAQPPLASGVWMTLAVVYEAAAAESPHARLYLNGERLAEAIVSEPWQWPDAAMLYLGGMPGGTTFSGKLDEVRLSNAARYRDTAYAVAQTLATDAQTAALWSFEAQTLARPWQDHARSHTDGARLDWFEAAGNAATVHLAWQTSMECNLAGFVIERRATSAASIFERCGYMPAVGISHKLQEYHFADAVPQAGAYYYRLRAVNEKGDCGYSDEIACSVPAMP